MRSDTIWHYFQKGKQYWENLARNFVKCKKNWESAMFNWSNKHDLAMGYMGHYVSRLPPLIARFMGPIWGLPRADRTQVGPVWATWTWLSGSPSSCTCQCMLHWKDLHAPLTEIRPRAAFVKGRLLVDTSIWIKFGSFWPSDAIWRYRSS